MLDIDSMFSLRGRVAIVTGAAGLLGQTFSETLLAAGATVYFLDIDEERLSELIGRLPEVYEGKALAAACDITNEGAIQEFMKRVEDASEGVDILVNSAAIDPKFEPTDSGDEGENGRFTSYPLTRWNRSLAVNVTGTFLVTRAVCGVMEKTGKGSIVNISSTYGLVGPDQRVYESSEAAEQRFFKPLDYPTTKAAVIGFTRALAAYYRGTQIRVNALCPGGVFNKNDKSFVKNYADRTILNRMANTEDYVGAMLYLCSDASSYMTGACIAVDGGWTAW